MTKFLNLEGVNINDNDDSEANDNNDSEANDNDNEANDNDKRVKNIISSTSSFL